jgi:hypothetical protein
MCGDVAPLPCRCNSVFANYEWLLTYYKERKKTYFLIEKTHNGHGHPTSLSCGGRNLKHYKPLV